MEEKTIRLLITGAILIVLAGGIFGGWFKIAADTVFGKAPSASTVAQTTTQPQQQTTTTTQKERTTQPPQTTTTTLEKPNEPEQVDILYKLEGQKYVEHQGYKFTLEKISVGEDNETSIDIKVVKPDGTEESHMADKNSNAMVDWVMIRFTGEYSKEENWATIKFLDYKATMKLERRGFQEYKGYRFKLNQFIYKNNKISAIIMDVVTPDGRVLELQTDNLAAGEWGVGFVDSISIEFHGEYPEDLSWAKVKIRETI